MNAKKTQPTADNSILTVRLLGTFEIATASGDPIELPTQKAKALFAKLVLAKSAGADRASTAAMLWSRGTDAQARTNLRQTLASIRRILPDADIIDSNAQTMRIKQGALKTDVDAIELPDHAAISSYIPTIGPLLDGLHIDEPAFSEWLTTEQSAFHRKVTTTLFELAELLIEQGALDDALSTNQRLLALDGFDEGAHRQTMRIYARQGAPAKALSHYWSLVSLLSKELDTAPDEATQKLMQALKSTGGAAQSQPMEVVPAKSFDHELKTSLSVQPFALYGTDLDLGFGVSLAEDIAIELGRFATLQVTRPGDSTSSQNSDYVVAGSIRVSGQRLRVSVQLMDNPSGSLIWADRYETKLADGFDLLEEITSRSVATIPGRIQADVAEKATRSSLDALSAHELMLRGKRLRDTLGAREMQEARDILQRAVTLDPSNARAHMYLSDTYVIDGWLGLGDRTTAKLALDLAKLAVSADHSDVFVQDHLGFAFLSNAMWQDGRAQIERTLQKIKHEVESNAWCGYALALLGDHKAALREVESATSRDQMPLATFGWIRGQVFSLNGRHEDAIDELRGASSLNSLALAFLAGDYARTGRSKEAATTLAEFVELRRRELTERDIPFDGETVQDLASGYSAMWKNPEDWDHIASGLKSAGLPDKTD